MSVILFALLCVGLLITQSHFTKSFIVFLIASANIFNVFYLFKTSDIVWTVLFSILSAILAACTVFVIFKFKKYDFNHFIVSFGGLFNLLNNKSNDKIIGKVFPYNKYQLKYNKANITMSDITAAGGTLISGSTGSGKTYGMIQLIKQDMLNGKSVVFCDYKGDPNTSLELKKFASNLGYKIFALEQEKSNFNYDPLKDINNSGRIEAIINMRKWSIDGADAHYRTSTQLLLQKLVGDYSHIWESKSSEEKLKTNFTFSLYEYAKTYNPARDEWDAYSTVTKLMELLLTSSLSDMFHGNNKYDFNFTDLNQNHEKFLLIISFVSSNKELATSFSSLMFKDLLDQASVIPFNPNLMLYIDEFGTIENPFIIKDILEKGRSGKICTTLALQDINQIIIQTNEAYLNSILGTINTFIIYSGATRVTAEKFAGVQLLEIDDVLMSLRKPLNGKSPTAIYISKYPVLNNKTNSEVFRFTPFVLKDSVSQSSNLKDENKIADQTFETRTIIEENKTSNQNYYNQNCDDNSSNNSKNEDIVDVDYSEFI